MIRREDLVKVGKFGKPHGVMGEIALVIAGLTRNPLSPPTPLRGASDSPLRGALNSPPEGGRGGAFLVCELDNIFVPFRVIESRIISDTTAYVRLKNLNSDEAVRILVNKDAYINKRTPVIAGLTRNPLTENPNTISWDYFLGYTLIDKNAGEIGIISEVDDSTLNTLFVVRSRHATPLLIPANADFIASIDEKRRQIHLELPEGLLEI